VNGRRPLGELLDELAGGIAGFAAGTGVRAHSLSIRLPIDLRLAMTEQGPLLIGELPLFRTRTDFDPDPARLQVEWHAVPVEAAP
jgi:hypothetical protein